MRSLRYACLTLFLGFLLGSTSHGQTLPCTGAAMGATAQVGNPAWTANSVPATTSVTRFCSITNLSTAIAIGSCNTALNGAIVSGPGIQPGTTLSGACGSSTLSLPATATNGSVTLTFTFPAYSSNFPPAATVQPTGVNCSVCPSLFTANICTNQYARLFMCVGNVYTISLCGSGTPWNSTLSVVADDAPTFSSTSTGFVTSNDDGCSPGGHAQLTFVPTTTNSYLIRIFENNGSGNACVSTPVQCGTITVTCAPAPPAPANDNPCGAVPLTVGGGCTMFGTTTSWATGTATPGPVSACVSFTASDVWYSAIVPGTGRLAVQTALSGATNLAMAIYSTTACNAALASWNSVACNGDIAAGVLQPYVEFNLPALALQTVYIRVWAQFAAGNGGTFEICAYEPILPPNDEPCNAVPVPVTAGCVPVSGTNQSATATAIGNPSCGTGPYNDIWYTVQVPVGEGVNIFLSSTELNNLAMAVYIGACGSLAQVVGACSAPTFPTQPSLQILQNGTTIVDNTILYVRVWHRNALFGNFSICASPAVAPANNNPCGAINLPVNYGCLFSGQTNTQATTTPVSLGGEHSSVPAPTCAPPATNDVWYTINVPAVPAGTNIVLDTYAGTMTNGAMAVYSAAGVCTGSLSLTQILCATNNPTAGSAMPIITLTSGTHFAANTATVLYVRVWREGAADGSFQICARRSDPPPGNCYYTLRMFDSAGDGWNGSTVTVCVDGVCTPYTISSALGTISFAANLGQVVTLTYAAVGGFQNQISYQLAAANGGILFSSGTTPATGTVFGLTVNGTCNLPPAPHEDCIGAVHVCSNTAQSANPQNTGSVADLSPSNRGCLVTNERRGVWYTFQATAAGQLGFTINPFPYGISDYDFGLWGPYSSITCPPTGLPLRCSWADGPSLTGLNWTATDFTEGVFGDSWTQYINVSFGDYYILYVDNWYMTGFAFDLTFTYAPGCGVGANPPCASIDCTLLPVEFISFGAHAVNSVVELAWSTATESGSSHFMVQRSRDGQAFETIGRVQAAGNSMTPISYATVDDAPYTGLSYYRLEQVDLNGESTHSQVVPVFVRTGDAAFSVFPNPATNELNITFETMTEGKVNWRVSDAAGRLVLSGNTGASEGTQLLQVPLNQVDAGSYFIEVSQANGSLGRKRFVKH
ncbi:MAG: T9SS type A sorting domain-containing protein [Flavobacteriales bacterium]|nr:T9SS type A sorting domain-containing protein [Flavobacteriales bacterium]